MDITVSWGCVDAQNGAGVVYLREAGEFCYRDRITIDTSARLIRATQPLNSGVVLESQNGSSAP